MRCSMDCFPCLLQQGIKPARQHLENEEEQRKLVKRIIAEMAQPMMMPAHLYSS